MTTPNPITIRLPSKYTNHPKAASTSSTTTPFTPPPLPFMHRTWTVTHSTLRMWRSARNVRITYGALPPKGVKVNSNNSNNNNNNNNTNTGDATTPKPQRARVSDLVEYESRSGSGGVKRVAGVDTAAAAGDSGSWDWRGSGLLFWVGSHWEVLGWGERAVEGGEEGEVERWMVTWFAPTLFTAEGLDVYSDRRQGGSEGLVREVLAELGRVAEGCGKLGELVEREMREVKVELPWKEA